MSLDSKKLLELELSVSKILQNVGKEIEKSWHEVQLVSLKDNREPVTEVDVNTEKYIRGKLSKLLPEAGFIVEEGDNDEKEEYNWTIDPIDQTKNFIGKIPLFYTQVALLQKGEPILGVIYNPISKQVLSASLGNGTKLNGEIVEKHFKDSLSEAVLDIDFGGANWEADWKFDKTKKLIESAYRIRMSGGAFSPYIITAGIDAIVIFAETIKVVDRMPRIIMAKEIGIVFEFVEIGKHKLYIAGTKNVVEEIKSIFSK